MSINYSAPGRINLIGEHTDYNLGYALPIALPQRTYAQFEPDDSNRIVASSAQADEVVEIALSTRPGDVEGWAGYVAGVVWALSAAGYQLSGGVLHIDSQVQIGSGLSSSAALECAVLGALTTGQRLPRLEQARIAQRAENVYVGAPTGLLDQCAALFGHSGGALLIDFRDMSIETVTFTPAEAGLALMVVNSRAPHRHAGGEYAQRRASCERAATACGVESLRELQDCGTGVLDKIADPVDRRRARHILTENQRVLDVVTALAANDYARVGSLFSRSHESMRDDFEITTDHIDAIVDTFIAQGALGARMTGGGFGGCVIALAGAGDVSRLSSAVTSAMTVSGYPAPDITTVEASDGAG